MASADKKQSGTKAFGLSEVVVRRVTAIATIAYLTFLTLFLLAELDLPSPIKRATPDLLLLVALIFLPVVLLASSAAIRSLRLVVNGKEVEVKLDSLDSTIDSVTQQLRTGLDLTNDSERVLYRLLAGNEPSAAQRIERGELVIGAKSFPSSELLAYFLRMWIVPRVPSIKSCRVMSPNGSTLQNFADLLHGRIDIYVEYTGTALQFFQMPLAAMRSSDAAPHTAIQLLNQRTEPSHGIRWMPHLGPTDDYRIVVREGFAQEKAISTISELKAYSSKLVAGSSLESLNRSDGIPALQAHYNYMQFAEVAIGTDADKYEQLAAGDVDVILGWQTDRELERKSEFRTLDDDRAFFPRYWATPLARLAALDQLEGLSEALCALEGVVRLEDLQDGTERMGHEDTTKVAERMYEAVCQRVEAAAVSSAV
jgi:glycine betaine/choline ABC-type transport system substrate-binding protein